jgi:hypothetical protein
LVKAGSTFSQHFVIDSWYFLLQAELQIFFYNSPVPQSYSFNFAAVLFSRNHINKAAAATLLIVLLFIHSVKLLHSHSLKKQVSFSGSSAKYSTCEKGSESVTQSFKECAVCHYQPARDSDNLMAASYNSLQTLYKVYSSITVSVDVLHHFSSFETRGPPVLI